MTIILDHRFFQFDVHLANQQTAPVVGTCQLLAAFELFKTILGFYIIDYNIPTILGMTFLATVNLKIDWYKCKVTVFGKSGQEGLVITERLSLQLDCGLLKPKQFIEGLINIEYLTP